jgi:hypothetical protein
MVPFSSCCCKLLLFYCCWAASLALAGCSKLTCLVINRSFNILQSDAFGLQKTYVSSMLSAIAVFQVKQEADVCPQAYN